MKRTWLATVFVLVFALVAAACTSDGGDDENDDRRDRRDRRRADQPDDVGGLHAAAARERVARVPLDRADGRGVRGGQPRHHDRAAVREQRQRAAEGDGRDPGQQAARHLLPVRHEHAAARAEPRARRPHGSRERRRLRLGGLLPRRAGGRDRGRQGARRSGARRQPGDRLQQGPVRGGRCSGADGGLDVGRPPRGRGRDDRSGQQGVRPELPGRRQRDHGVAVHRDAVGGRRRHPERGQHRGDVQRRCRGSVR